MIGLDHVHLQWFGDPPPDPAPGEPAPGPDPQPPAGPEPLSADGTFLAQAPDKYKRDQAKLKDLLPLKSWGAVLDRLYASESQLEEHRTKATELEARLTAEQARAAELEKAGGAPAPKELKLEDYKLALPKLPAFMSTDPAFSAYSKDLTAYLEHTAGEIKALMHAAQVPPATAQKVVELFCQKHYEAMQASVEDTQQRRAKALDRLKAEWKGDFAANEDLAARAIRTLGGNELAQEIAAAGFADHPLMIRIFCNIGKVIGEGHMVPGRPAPSPQGVPGASDRERQQAASARRRYPNSPELTGAK